MAVPTIAPVPPQLTLKSQLNQFCQRATLAAFLAELECFPDDMAPDVLAMYSLAQIFAHRLGYSLVQRADGGFFPVEESKD